MKRLRVILGFLLLGAIVNIAVAWTFALFVKTYKFESHDVLEESHIVWWREHVPPGWKHAPGAVTFWPTIGADSYLYTEFAGGPTLGNNVSRRFAGFPLRSMEGASYVDQQRRIGWSNTLMHVEGFWFIPNGKLPLRVRWPQTVVNAALYALLLAVAYRVGLSRVRTSRRRRQRCTNCGYDLRGSEHVKCPECGMVIVKANPA